MKKIAVIGAGTMGLDIAQVFARSGFSVTVRDISDEINQKAEKRMSASLDKLVSKGKLAREAADAMLDRITYTTELSDAADADLVIEAVIEDLKVKLNIFAELDRLCKPDTIFASNTSSISITAMAAATFRPEKFIGMHFFNPATVMKLVELIRGTHTSDKTLDTVSQLSIAIGKEPIEVNEAPGFVVNRLLIPVINEAIGLVESGVASVEDVDRAMKLGANHPMGPLELGDLVGLDVCLAIMDVLYDETKDSKYRASALLRKMVRGGLLGRKTGKGFYTYPKEQA